MEPLYQLDKKKFGAFLAQLRREKGLTQKELADQLYISNQAVSKWETGVSIPDTALLIPLANLLGVSLTELLQGERMLPDTNLPSTQVDRLIKTMIYYPQKTPDKLARQEQYDRKIRSYLYLLSIGTSGGLFFFLNLIGSFSMLFRDGVFLRVALLTALFAGAYFMLFANKSRPILGFFDTSWARIVSFGRVWCMMVLIFTPILTLILYSYWEEYDVLATLLLLIGGFILPIFHLSNKIE